MMVKIVLFLVMACLSLTVNGQGIRFEKGTLEDALKKAKAENKMVFVDAYAVWCGPCKWMANNVFKEKKVGDYFDKHIVAIKIDVERGEGPSVQSRYAIEGLPGYLFLDSDGNIVFRGSGSMPADKFMEMVEKARASAMDPNSVGRLAARYPVERNNEVFLEKYLEKLKTSGSAGYHEVVEQYLKVQRTMKADSREMVMFLYDHAGVLVFGGEADRILRENLWSEAWDEHAWKKIRECFQKLPDNMARQTVEYAVVKRDTAWLRISCRRATETGVKIADDQMERLLIYFYLQTENGSEYKKLAKPQLDSFYHGLNVAELRAGYQRVLEQTQKNPDRKRISFAEINSDKLRAMIAEYARFAVATEDGEDILRWSRRVYELLPEAARSVCFYAKALYLFGDKTQGMRLMTEAVRLGEGEKNTEGFRKDLESMQAGDVLHLVF